ncbi:MAG: hypothetical protein V4655_03250 [Bdellovibrionota bacterium]
MVTFSHFTLILATLFISTSALASLEDDVKALAKIVAIQQAELQSVKSKQAEGQAYYYTGAFATSKDWEADLIFNKNYGAFCKQLGKTLVRGEEITQHYHVGRGNGYFYKGWFYLGSRYCADDTHIYGTEQTGTYNVWRYNGNCGCCIDRGSSDPTHWSMEMSAIIYCK